MYSFRFKLTAVGLYEMFLFLYDINLSINTILIKNLIIRFKMSAGIYIHIK